MRVPAGLQRELLRQILANGPDFRSQGRKSRIHVVCFAIGEDAPGSARAINQPVFLRQTP